MFDITINLDKSASQPIYQQLYEYFKNEIISGHLEAKSKLPSIRELSKSLKISKTTVETTYHQLYVEGYIKSRPKVGYFVNAITHNPFQYLPKKNIKSFIREEKSTYDFGHDHIDLESFDFSLWKKYLNRALMNNKEQFLNYGSFQGEEPLRIEIAKYVHNSRGVICRPDQIIIGAGVQSLLNILCGILKSNFMSIGFEDPGFNQARHIFSDHDFNVIPINLDSDGINIERLEKSRAQMVYISPSHQFPTGATMPIAKRLKLLNWAHKNQTLIIEDDYDSELRYVGRPVPSLQGLSSGKNVIYLGTFSKILLPAIRISYMILPEDLKEKYQDKMGKYNQSSSKIEQLALALFMRDGYLEKHIRKLRKTYGNKNQILLKTLEDIMGNKINIMGQESGLHFLLEIKTSYSSEEIANLAKKVGVKVIPISNFFMKGDSHNYPLVLLSYGGIPIEDIKPAVELLNKVWFGNPYNNE